MKTTRIGAACWLAATPLFLAASVITGSAWKKPAYSWALNNISDLGNVTCGMWDTTRSRPVCSPWHPVMNAAFTTTGLLLIAGLVLTWPAMGRGAAAAVAKVLALAGGVGFALVGLYPADVNENAHFLAAILIFALANTGLLTAALGRSGALARVRLLSAAMGLAGLTGSALFFAQIDLGLGLATMERIAVYPLLAWTLTLAILLRRRRTTQG